MTASALTVWPFGGAAPLACDARGSYALQCWTDYVLISASALTLPRNLGKALPVGESGEHQVLVNFGDYVGELEVGGRALSVSTPKMDAEGFDALLRDITARCASLPFDYQSPTRIPYERTALDERDLLYHAFIYLRWALGAASPSLLEVLALVESDPHRTLVREAVERPLWEAQSASPALIQDALRSPDRWCELPPASRANATAFARRVAAACGRSALPATVREPHAHATFDTPENRFVRYFVEFLTELLDRVAECFRAGDGAAGPVEARFADEALALRQQIEPWRRRAFLEEVGPMRVFPASSQVLQRRSGYRELLEHYLALILAARFPISGADLTRLMEAKEASKLYEYWTFFEMADLVRLLAGEPLEASTIVRNDEFTAYVPENEIRIRYPGEVELAYNRSFGGNLRGSYSVTLRPDITLDVGDVRHFFDAKFRVERKAAVTTSSDEAEDQAIAAALPSGWFKAADICKMHTYREAIRGSSAVDVKPVATVWVLYPGSEFRFFDEERGRLYELPEDITPQGVGAIPVAPGDDSVILAELLGRLLRPLHTKAV